MKNLFTLLLLCALTISGLWAQVPQAMKYQSVIRNTAGQPITNSNVGLRFTILENGSDVYQETYDLNTNDYGLVNLNIGEGSTTDSFSSINWTSADFALQVELDPTGGTNYQLMGSSPMLSVPFALKAASATTADNVDDADANPSNEIQTLSINNNTLSISGSNSVDLPSGGGDIDPDGVAKAWARVEINGTCNTTFDAHGVNSTNKISTGVYNVSLQPGLFSIASNPSITATIINDLQAGVAIPTYGSSPSQMTIRTYDMNGNLSDRAFSVTVMGKTP